MMPTAETALPGRADPIPTADEHDIFSRPLKGPYPEGTEKAMFGIGLLLGRGAQVLEPRPRHLDHGGRLRGRPHAQPDLPGGLHGQTGHNEVVLVVYDPKRISYETLLKTFWESHDPTQGMRQGNDVGTQYRSGIYTFSEAQRAAALPRKAAVPEDADEERIRTRSPPRSCAAPEFYFAEDYHQQYLAKVPHGYCGLGGTGVSCPMPTGVTAEPAVAAK